MPANRKVSVAWQIVFTFLPIVNFWAFYRIRKLQKYALWVILPAIALSIAVASYYFYVITKELIDGAQRPNNNTSVTINGTQFNVEHVGPTQGSLRDAFDASRITLLAASTGLHGLSIYLVIIWSRAHNRTFGTPA